MHIFFRNFLAVSQLVALGLTLVLASSAVAQSTQQPNIVFFFSDDQGWNHHSVPMFEEAASANSEFFQTPNIERIAEAGMRFSTAYSAAPMCNPSRRSMHSGRSMSQVMFSGESEEQQAEALTIGEMMQSAGYRTAHLGKWSPGPATSGLDFYDVSDGGFGNGDGNYNTPGDPKQIFGITDRANAFIEDSVEAGQPFYIQFSHFGPHSPAHALDETMEKWNQLSQPNNPNPALSAMTEDLDTGVGAILDKLEELGISDNTYVVYTSDHGQTPNLSRNAPLTSGKGTLWEGGIRVPFIVSGPGIEAGTISHTRTVSLDLFPTFAELAGINYPLPDNLEGGNLMPLLLGDSSEIRRPREELIFHFPSGSGQADFRPMSSLYLGDYKLVKLYDTNELMLFNITEDIAEQLDFAESMPDRTAELDNMLVSYLDEMGVNVFTSQTTGGAMGGGMGGN